MKYYIIAGEASGDLHGSNLMKAIREVDPDAAFRFWGGDCMQQQGGQLIRHYRDLAFMGFIEVVANLRTIAGNLRFCKQDLDEYRPDALILIDYPGFNLRIAEYAHQQGIRVFYYISPQVWAWKKGRVKTIRQVVDKMFVILPFEKDFYLEYDYEVEFVGHPLLDAFEDYPFMKEGEFLQKNNLDSRPIVAMLPGSRKQEISKMLHVMLSVVPFYKEFQFVVATAPSVEKEFYRKLLGNRDVQMVENQTYNLLKYSYAAMVTSGTATLETALLEVPEVVCYKGNFFSYHIAKNIVDVKYISLVNLIADKEVVKELIQNDLNVKNLKKQLDLLLFNRELRKRMIGDFKDLKRKLGGTGASRKTAGIIYQMLK